MTKILYAVRLDQETLDYLDRVAVMYGTTRSEMLRIILHQQLPWYESMVQKLTRKNRPSEPPTVGRSGDREG